MGLSRKELAEREEAIIEFAELGEFIDSPVKQYSSGMFMRLAFSIATEVDPDILLVDEILSVGDAEFREKCNARLQQFRSRSKTIILVSHELQTLSSICTRLVLLDHGKLIEDGPAEKVLQTYKDLTKQPEQLKPRLATYQ